MFILKTHGREKSSIAGLGLLLILLCALTYSCEKEEMNLISNISEVQNETVIPCTVENMQKAYENLLSNPTAAEFPGLKGDVVDKSERDYVVSTTHYYYRFLPSNSEEYEQLVNDEVLAVSDVPFELDAEDNGINYVDQNFSEDDGSFPYFYSVVPIAHDLPQGIHAEHLADLHFTSEEEIGENPSTRELQALDFFYDLNLEALKISGKLVDEERRELTYLETNNTRSQSMLYDEVLERRIPFSNVIIDFSEIETFEKRIRWNPSGRVTVEEDVLTKISDANNILGVRNATIKIRKWGWLVIRRAETVKDGRFSASRIRTRRVKYAVYFQPRDKRFTIKAGTIFWDARHRGTIEYKRRPWNQHFPLIGNAPRSHFYALVHNAAADYTFDWVSDQGFMLSRPWWGIRISAKFNSSGSNWTGFLHDPNLGIGGFTSTFISEIRVARESNDRYRGSDGIYATTTHELTHAGHYSMDRLHFIGIGGIFDAKQRDLIVESWAEGVETIVTNHRYDLIAPGNNIQYNFIRQRMAVRAQGEERAINEYTPIFIDLEDNFNQNAVFSALTPRPPVDRVSGYTIPQMQESLRTSRTLVQLENRLRNLHNNPTENNLAELFQYPAAVLQTLQDE